MRGAILATFSVSTLRTQGPSHRQKFCDRCLPTLPLSKDHAVWVPAFAGTTMSCAARTFLNVKQPSLAKVIQNRRMGGAKRYPSIAVLPVDDGFHFALPILQEDTPSHSRGARRPE
jgi:hypothetical protein